MWSTQSHTFTKSRGLPVCLEPRKRSEDGTSNRRIRHSASCQPFSRSDPTQPSCSNTKFLVPDVITLQNELPPTYVPHFHDEKLLRRMTYKRLGMTDMFLSKIALGCGPISGIFGEIISPPFKIIEAALKSGINLIDAGYWYGQRRSEEILGKVLKKFPRNSYYVSVRVGRFELDYTRPFEYRAENILQSLTHTLKRLGLPYVDICYVQIHDLEIDFYKHTLMYETLPALKMAQSSGKVRYIGLTGYSLKKLALVIESSPVHIDVVMSYCRGTLDDNTLGEFLKLFESKQIGVINASPLSMGLLTVKGPPLWHPSAQEVKDACLQAVTYCTARKTSVEKLALYYALNFPGICSCCVGMDSVQQILQNIEISQLNFLTETEQRVQDRILRRYLDKLQNANWEGMNVEQYWIRLQKLGIATLTKHNRISLDSISTNLTSIPLR